MSATEGQDPTGMTDRELAAELTPDDPARGLEILARATPERRAAWQRLVEVARSLNAGTIPPGVMVDRTHGDDVPDDCR